jgi:amino acid transporter
MATPAGLARRTLSGGALFFFSVGASAPLTVVAGGVVATYASTGVVGVPAAFPLVTAALALFTVGYVAMARRAPHAGPLYAQVARGFGPLRGLCAAPLAVLAYHCIQCSLFGLLGFVVSGLLGGAWWIWALVAWAAVAALGLLHVTLNARLLALLLAAEIAVVVLFDATALASPADGALDLGPLLPTSLVGDGAGGVFALTVAAFVGYESTLAYGEEARGHRPLARATFGALLFIGALYAASSWAMAVAVGPERVVAAARDPESGLPLALLSDRYGPIMGLAATLLLVTSVFAAMLSFHHTTARYVFVLGREGVLPARFGTTGRGSRAGAPVGGSVVQSIGALVVVLGCAALGADPVTGLFTVLSTVAAIGIMVLMVVASLAALRFYRRGGGTDESGWTRVVAPATGALAVGAVLVATLANLGSVLGVAPGSPVTWAVPGVVALVALVGLAWGLRLRRRPEVYARIGRGEPEPLAELEHDLSAVDV